MSAGDQDQPDRSVASNAPVEDVEKTNENENTVDDKNGSNQPDSSLAASSASNVPVKGIERANDNEHTVDDQNGSIPNEYPHGLKLIMLLLSIYISLFLVALDRTIIATALPQITDHFKSFGDIGWVCLVSPAIKYSNQEKTDKMIFR